MKEKKKILYIVTKSNFGGAQKYVFDLATSLPRDKYEIVVAFGGSGELKDRLEKEHIRTISLPSLTRDVSLIKDLRVFRELLFLYKKEQPDVIHLNSSKIGALGSLAGRMLYTSNFLKPKAYRLSPRIIFTAHGWAFNEKRNWLVRLIILKLSAVTAILATDVIVLSQKEKKQTRWFLVVPKKKVHLIRNGIRPFAYLPRNEAREKLGLSQDTQYIGVIAELHTNKGLDTLIRTAPHLSAEFVLIGDGEEKETLQALAQDLGIREKIHFLGSIQHASLYLKAFDVFAFPSRKEGLPFALLEAGHAGVPTVATKVGGIPEIIIDQNTGLLVQPNNPEELQDALEKMLHNREFAQEMQQNFTEHVRNNFSFKKTLELTLELY